MKIKYINDENWGIHKKYSALSWWENFMGGSIHFLNITIFGANAMRWCVNIRTKRWGYICFTLPVKARYIYRKDGSKYWSWYFYISPNGTPWACTYYVGSDKNEAIRAKIRKLNMGHAFDTRKNEDKLRAINDKFSSLYISEMDLEEYGRFTD